MLLLPEDSPDFCDEWIEDLRLEVDLGIIEVNDYIASCEGDLHLKLIHTLLCVTMIALNQATMKILISQYLSETMKK